MCVCKCVCVCVCVYPCMCVPDCVLVCVYKCAHVITRHMYVDMHNAYLEHDIYIYKYVTMSFV